MDCNRLLRFVLLGSGDLEQYAILMLRVSLGLFFAISGANKLFVAARTQSMYETLLKAVPDSSAIHLDLANVYLQIRRPQKAIPPTVPGQQ